MDPQFERTQPIAAEQGRRQKLETGAHTASALRKHRANRSRG